MPDDRVNKVMDTLNLKEKHLRKLYKVFSKCDKDKSGSMDTDEFYKAIGEKPSIFGDSIFELIDVDNNGHLDFGEFCEAIGTFCMFGTDEILKFCFYIFDKDKNGYISPDELQDLVGLLHSYSLSNMNQVMKELSGKKGDALINFARFKAMHESYPFILFPAFRIQDILQRITLGEAFWERTKRMKKFDREEAAGADRKSELEAIGKKERMIMTIKLDMLKRRHGGLKYYCCFYCFIVPRLPFVTVDDFGEPALQASKRPRRKNRDVKKDPKSVENRDHNFRVTKATHDRERGRPRIGKRRKEKRGKRSGKVKKNAQRAKDYDDCSSVTSYNSTRSRRSAKRTPRIERKKDQRKGSSVSPLGKRRGHFEVLV